MPVRWKSRLRKKHPDSQSWQDDISLSQSSTGPPLQGRIVNDGGQERTYWRSVLCYSLHAFLVAIHLILLSIALSHHAERRVVIQHDIELFVTGLSGGLQAFYTLYTALLVFITQRLMLSSIFASPKKLTQIHDICGAWAGLGAALSALWQQTKVASSILSIALVTAYFACISVLHVTSSTLIQLQLFNDTMTNTSQVLETWPNFTSIDLALLDWEMAALIPFLQDLYGNTTNGLANNTLYDILESDFINATAHATTVSAHCGLLTNLSIETGNIWNVSASMSALGPITIVSSYPPLPDEIWFTPSIGCPQQICQSLLLYLVSAEMEVDDSLSDVSRVYINGSYSPPGGIAQNFSTPTYFVACSLNSTYHTVVLDSSGIQLDYGVQQSDVAWSAFSLVGDLNFTSQIGSALEAANSLPVSPYCQPVMLSDQLVSNVTAFNVYMRLLLGMGISSCSTAFLEQYTSTSPKLTRDKFEGAVSQAAAEFLWLAGELGAVGGGFDRETEEALIMLMVQQWKLNINPLPVIISLSASVILFVLVVCALWRYHQTPVFSAGVLEMMWFGSRSQVLRSHLCDVQTPSLDGLRASSMFEIIFWTRSANKDEGNNGLYAPVPLHSLETRTSSSRSTVILGSEALHLGDVSRDTIVHRLNASRDRLWCYTLHVILVVLHVSLLSLLVHHPEHSVVILSESGMLTVGLSAFLQAFYTLYSAVLVLLMQRLALFKIISKRRKLTTVHDVSGAWTGIGAAIYTLWQQHKAPSSTWEVIGVGAYLALMLVLHITSSSIMQWQAFEGNLTGIVQTNLALPDSSVDISQLRLADILPIVQSIGEDTNLPTHGLSNATLYDVLQNPGNVTFTYATVNATTITAQCGLVPNLTLSSNISTGEYQINFQNGPNSGTFLEYPIWKDIVRAITPNGTQCLACPQTLFYIITTGINVDESVHDPVVVELNWTYTPLGKSPQTSITSTYVAACSVNAQTAPAVLNTKLDVLEMAPELETTVGLANSSWPMWSPGNATNLSVGIATALWDASPVKVMYYQERFIAQPSNLDLYIMSLLGLSWTSANMTHEYLYASTDPSTTLSPWQLENAIAETAAKFLWLAGQVGENWGGFQHSAGESLATNNTIQFRLHLNTIPVILASIATFLSLILAMFIVGKSSGERAASVSGTSVLECLWLEAHSESLHTCMEAIDEPHVDRLRAAGMFDICLGDTGPSSYQEAR